MFANRQNDEGYIDANERGQYHVIVVKTNNNKSHTAIFVSSSSESNQNMGAVRLQLLGGKFDGQDRRLPVSLERFLLQDEWETLQGRVERELVPDIRLHRALLALTIGLFFVVAFSFFALSKTSVPLFSGIVGFWCLLILLNVIHLAFIQPIVKEAARQVLYEYSSQYVGISFHLHGQGTKWRPYVLEVHVDGNQYDKMPSSQEDKDFAVKKKSVNNKGGESSS